MPYFVRVGPLSCIHDIYPPDEIELGQMNWDCGLILSNPSQPKVSLLFPLLVSPICLAVSLSLPQINGGGWGVIDGEPVVTRDQDERLCRG